MTEQDIQDGAGLVFVGNLSRMATENEVRTLFERVGPVEYVKLPVDPHTRRPKNVAYVQYKRPEDAGLAVRQLNDEELNGRPLRVSIARPREEREKEKQLERQERERKEREYDDYMRHYNPRAYNYSSSAYDGPRYRSERSDRYERDRGYDRYERDREFDRYERDRGYDQESTQKRSSNQDVIATLTARLISSAPHLTRGDLDALTQEIDRIIGKYESDDMYASLRNLQ